MRLIDADMLNFENQHYNKSQMKAILDFIDEQPTAYDIDKVVERLEAAKSEIASEGYCRAIYNKELCENRNCFECYVEYIVKAGGKDD